MTKDTATKDLATKDLGKLWADRMTDGERHILLDALVRRLSAAVPGARLFGSWCWFC